ncbi:hypothetical protein MMM2322_00351 [Microbacterium sp. MM2322]
MCWRARCRDSRRCAAERLRPPRRPPRIATSDVWFTAYPISLITRPGQSFLFDPRRRRAVVGVRADRHHCGPHRSGQARRRHRRLGRDPQRRRSLRPHQHRHRSRLRHGGRVPRALRHVAESHGGSIIDDIVPGHTGKGADFRLAEMGFKDYPGTTDMVAIPPEDWHLLPDVPEGYDSVNLDPATEHTLAEHGYIIGALQRVIFYTPGVKETNWSATAPAIGPDGITRRCWSTCITSSRVSPPSTGWTRPSPVCASSSATRCTRSASLARARCASTPTDSSASRRAPRVCRRGRRGIRSRTPRTTSSRAWSARSAGSRSRS